MACFDSETDRNRRVYQLRAAAQIDKANEDWEGNGKEKQTQPDGDIFKWWRLVCGKLHTITENPATEPVQDRSGPLTYVRLTIVPGERKKLSLPVDIRSEQPCPPVLQEVFRLGGSGVVLFRLNRLRRWSANNGWTSSRNKYTHTNTNCVWSMISLFPSSLTDDHRLFGDREVTCVCTMSRERSCLRTVGEGDDANGGVRVRGVCWTKSYQTNRRHTMPQRVCVFCCCFAAYLEECIQARNGLFWLGRIALWVFWFEM